MSSRSLPRLIWRRSRWRKRSGSGRERLDEATSALDSEVEAAIQASLYRLMEGKTVVAIAHRLSTIAAMDRLIVLDKGRIVEEGDHRSLLALGGIYARLWAHQSGGFLGADTDDEAPAAAQRSEALEASA